MKLPKIRPRGKQILVKQESEKSRLSEHGLSTPDSVEQERKAIGEVVAVGPEIKDVKKGDRVIFGTYAGEHIKIKGQIGKEEDYVLLFDDDVLAFWEE